MKKVIFISIVMSLLCYGCKNEDNDQSLKRTHWKLSGIIDAETGILTELEPKDCTDCYTLTFKSDTDYSTSSSIGYTGTYKVDYTTSSIHIISFGGPGLPEENEDGELYCKAFVSAQSISFVDNELRLYYNDNRNYLLFKSKMS